MLNIFKKPKKLTAITKDRGLAAMFPVVKASEALPNWHATMRSYFNTNTCPVKTSIVDRIPTIKGCFGVNELLHTGFIMPAWSDISILVYPDGKIAQRCGDGTERNVHVHDRRQAPDTFGECVVIKLESPWYFESSVKFVWLGTPYHHPLAARFFAPSAIIEFEYQNTTNAFLVLPLEDKVYEVMVRAGQPLVHLIPMCEEPVSLEVVVDRTYERRNMTKHFLLHGYRRGRNALKKLKRKIR